LGDLFGNYYRAASEVLAPWSENKSSVYFSFTYHSVLLLELIANLQKSVALHIAHFLASCDCPWFGLRIEESTLQKFSCSDLLGK